MDQIDWLGSAIAAAVGAAGLWLANRLMGKAAVQQAINTGFAEIMKAEKQRYDTLLAEMERRDAEHQLELAQLRGEFINLFQAYESLKAHMRRQGIDVPESPHWNAPVQQLIELRAPARGQDDPEHSGD